MRKILEASIIGVTCLFLSILICFILSIVIVFILIISKVISVNSLSGAMQTYIHIINYLLNPFVNNLQIFNYTLSEHGYQHFEEVKHLVSILEILTVPLTISTILRYRYLKKKHCLWSWRNSLYILLWIGMPVGFVMAGNFNGLFIEMHKILFKNNYWLFDPYKDSVIQLMPIQLFISCGIIILSTYELLVYILYRKVR